MGRARITDSTRRDTAADYTPATACVACQDTDPQVRHRHYLFLARELSFDAIEAHLYSEIGQRCTDSERLRDYVASIMAWVKDQVQSYSHIADPETGWLLPWHEGRRQTLRALHASTEATRQRNEAAQEQRQARDVSGFSRVLAKV